MAGVRGREAFLAEDESFIPGSRAGDREAGQREWWGGNSSQYYQYFSYAVVITFVVSAVALGFGTAAYVNIENERNRFHIDAVCNRGNNAGTELPALCEDILGVPGLNLVTGSASRPNIAFLKRILKGIGVNITSFADSHIEIGVLLESLNPQLVIGEGSPTPDNDRPITLDLDLSGLNVSSVGSDGCGIDGNGTAGNLLRLAREAAVGSPPSLGFEPTEGFIRDKIIAESDCVNATNLYISFPYAGHGISIGDGHTFPNDGTVDRSGILGGLNHVLQTSAFATIGGGSGNEITGSDGSVILSGSGHTITDSPYCGIGGGQGNTIVNVASADAFILAGSGNLIDGADDAIILGGQANTNAGAECFIGTGFNNEIGSDASRSGIVVGHDHLLGTTGTVTNSIILGGDTNSLNSVDNAAILAGNNLAISGSDFDNTAITQHLLVTESFRTSGVRTVDSTSDTPTAADYMILVETTTAGSTVVITVDGTLPTGTNLVVKDIQDASVNNIEVTSSGVPLCPIGGACATPGTQTISTTGGSVTLIKTASDWIVVSA